MADVFVSYSRRDRARVAPLIEAIEGAGWSVWWDPAIVPGQEFDRQIDAELKIAAAVLVVWTADSVQSRWVRGEARDAADRGILVPVRFDRATLPIDVRAIHTIDIDDSDTAGGSVQEMLRALGGLIGKHAAKPAGLVNGGAIAPAAATARAAICVLPFTNMSGDPAQEYFSDGITEDIITELSRWRFMAVRSRSAAFRYRGAAVDMQRVARELNVRFIVEGSVRRSRDRIRISAQLIDAESGDHVWADKFDHESDDVFTMQDQVVRTIVSTLAGRVQVSNVEQARRKAPSSLAAYECILKGNALPWDDPDAAAEAERLFAKAIEIDPDYGMAHALLAAIRFARWRDAPDDSNVLLEEAHVLAKRAVDLDANESTCFAMLAHTCLLRRRFDQALLHARRAVELNPTNQWNMADLAVVLNYSGQREQALVWLKQAKDTDPYFDPPWYWRALAMSYIGLRRYEDALSMLGHASFGGYRHAALMAVCHARLDDSERARASAQSCLSLFPQFSTRRFIAKEPFKNPEDAAHFAESLLLAGLPP